MEFVNRVDELAALERWWSSASPRLAMVWGRRRVGKTALVQRFAAGRPSVFHAGAARPARVELERLSALAARIAPERTRSLLTRPYSDWDEALDDLAEMAATSPMLLVLDEFPEIVATAPGLPGILRAFLDRSSGHTQLRVLLCGSAVRHMAAIQEQRAPLYGRFDLSLPLHPFRPHEAALMLPGLAPADRALVYGLVGGMPLYLSWWDAGSDVAANLARLIGHPGAPLLTEGELILATEVERGGTAGVALHAIASGHTQYGEIKDQIRAEPARTLERLVELRLVERLLPVTDTGRGRRRTYRIADNFLAFYLGVVLRYRSEIERGLGESLLPVILESLDDHLGAAWEEAFREHLRRLARGGAIGPGVVAIGPYWSANARDEIDAVVLAGRRRLPIMVGEAKWTRSVNGARLAAGLMAKAHAIPGIRPAVLEVGPADGGGDDRALTAGGENAVAVIDDGAPARLALCARHEVSGAPPDSLVITADDIFVA